MNLSDERALLLEDLKTYQKHWLANGASDFSESPQVIPQFKEFITNNPKCFHRENTAGHITASGFVVNADFTKVLLTHHRKLNDWLQLGGHADGDPIPSRVALKECQEESGLTEFSFVNFWDYFKSPSSRPLVFDLDCHLIPARKNEPEHFHYDLRYLLVTDADAPLQITEESNDLKWASLKKEAYDLATQPSMHRPFKKIEFLKDKLVPFLT